MPGYYAALCEIDGEVLIVTPDGVCPICYGEVELL